MTMNKKLGTTGREFFEILKRLNETHVPPEKQEFTRSLLDLASFDALSSTHSFMMFIHNSVMPFEEEIINKKDKNYLMTLLPEGTKVPDDETCANLEKYLNLFIRLYKSSLLN